MLAIVALVLAVGGEAWADRSVLIQAEGEHYPRCGVVDAKTAKRWARKGLKRVREASIAAHGRAMEILAKAKWMRGLERLRVCTDDRGLRALAKVKWTRLRDLEVASELGVLFEAESVAKLVHARGMRRLERLRFYGSDSEAEHCLGPEGARAIAEHARLPRLRFLELGFNPLDEASVVALLQSDLARQLEELDLCQTAIAVDALVDAKLTSLKRLCMSQHAGPGVTDEERQRIDAAYPGVLVASDYWLDEP